MLIEPALIVARAENSLELRAARAGHCSGCSMKHGCGQYLQAAERQSLMLNPRDCDFVGDPAVFRPGNTIALCMAENTVLRATLLFYLFPLIPLLLATAMASTLTTSEGLTTLAALAGLAVGFALLPHCLQWYQQRQPWRPLLRERLQPMESLQPTKSPSEL